MSLTLEIFSIAHAYSEYVCPATRVMMVQLWISLLGLPNKAVCGLAALAALAYRAEAIGDAKNQLVAGP